MPPAINTSFEPILFARGVQQDTGANTSSETLFKNHVAPLLLDNYYDSFSVDDALAVSRSLDIDANELERLFKSWVARLVLEGKATECRGCYNRPVYKTV